MLGVVRNGRRVAPPRAFRLNAVFGRVSSSNGAHTSGPRSRHEQDTVTEKAGGDYGGRNLSQENHKRDDTYRRTSGDGKAIKNPEEVKQRQEMTAKSTASSLFDQLFPEQRGSHAKTPPPEPPPLEQIMVKEEDKSYTPSTTREQAFDRHWTRSGSRLRKEISDDETELSVLVLRNAGTNLVEDDFRRLEPKGKHMDSWTRAQGSILNIVPMRQLSSLAPTGSYYLIFESALSAFTYQGYASRIHRMVAAHTPSSLLSPLPPPPGYLIDGEDAYEAMAYFTLVPPTQNLDLRQLKPPLSPKVQEIVQYGGYAPLMKRRNRMPFEARITMEGPQLSASAVRHLLLETARSRALTWSGHEDFAPYLSYWRDFEARSRHDDATDDETSRSEQHASLEDPQLPRRTPPVVLIAGFHTYRALQTFMAYWHRRPMELKGKSSTTDEDYDLPPIANVERLW